MPLEAAAKTTPPAPVAIDQTLPVPLNVCVQVGRNAVAVNVSVLPNATALSVLVAATGPSVQATLALPLRSVVTVAGATEPPPDFTVKATGVPLADGFP